MALDELFELTTDDTKELLNVVATGGFNSKRATYFSFTSALLDSNVYKKIEKAVEERLGRQVYFIFDELFTPSGDLSPDSNSFQCWHKDAEDESFDEGCWNIWIPLFSSGTQVDGLEVITEPYLAEYDVAHDSKSMYLPFPIANDELLFLKKSTMDIEVVKTSKIDIIRPAAKLYHVYLLDSSRFHKAIDSKCFQLRFGIKFSVNPFRSFAGAADDIMAFAFAHKVIKQQLPAEVPPKELHYAAAKFVSQNLVSTINQPDIKSHVLYESLIEKILRSF